MATFLKTRVSDSKAPSAVTASFVACLAVRHAYCTKKDPKKGVHPYVKKVQSALGRLIVLKMTYWGLNTSKQLNKQNKKQKQKTQTTKKTRFAVHVLPVLKHGAHVHCTVDF